MPSHIELFFDEDKTHLYLQLSDVPEGSDHLAASPETVLEFLNNLGVQNPDQDAVKTALTEAGHKEPVLVASGQPPKHGLDGRIEYKFDTEPQAAVSLVEDESGRVDFRELGTVPQVKEGEVVAEIIDPTDGKPGLDVFGNPVQPRPGKPVPHQARIGRNIALDEKGRKAIAKTHGLITLERGRLSVSPLYKISGDVDFKTGNVRFDGDVIINSSVREDFRVEVTGSIQIGNNVERATVIAGSNISVGGGIIGKEGTEVVAGDTVVASYANNATIKASESITIRNEMVHSVARAARVLVNSGRGAVLGGQIYAAKYINVKSAGDRSSCVETVLEIGYKPELIEQIDERREQATDLNKKYKEAESAYTRLNELRKKHPQGLSKPAVRKLEELRELLVELREKQNGLDLEIAALEKELRPSDDSKIVVQEKLHPGARIVIFGASMDIKEPVSGGTFILHDGEVTSGRRDMQASNED